MFNFVSNKILKAYRINPVQKRFQEFYYFFFVLVREKYEKKNCVAISLILLWKSLWISSVLNQDFFKDVEKSSCLTFISPFNFQQIVKFKWISFRSCIWYLRKLVERSCVRVAGRPRKLEVHSFIYVDRPRRP